MFKFPHGKHEGFYASKGEGIIYGGAKATNGAVTLDTGDAQLTGKLKKFGGKVFLIYAETNIGEASVLRIHSTLKK